MELPELLTSLVLGLGLSAACGFRIFIPLLIMSVAARADYLSLASGFEWLETTPALVVLASATVLEVGAYYVPFIDNLLDGLAAPTAVVAGTLATATQIGDMNPVMTWSLAAIVGGGSAGVVQALTTAVRSVSSFATAGFGNPVVSTAEAGASVVMSILMLIVPFFTVLALLVLMYFAAKKVFEWRRSQSEPAAA